MKILRTKRLLLRPFEMKDVKDFNEYSTQEDVGPNAGWPPHTSVDESKEILESFIENNETFAIVEISSNKVIGSIGVHNKKNRAIESRELGYVLSHDYWGNGYMNEAVQAVLEYCFEDLKLELVTVAHFVFNERSKRVIEKAGFVYEGCMRKIYKYYTGEALDSCVYSMLKEEWLERE